MGWKERFVVDLNKMEQRERINEMKAFNGNLKLYFQVPISFVRYTYNFESWIHIKNSTFITISKCLMVGTLLIITIITNFTQQ